MAKEVLKQSGLCIESETEPRAQRGKNPIPWGHFPHAECGMILFQDCSPSSPALSATVSDNHSSWSATA